MAEDRPGGQFDRWLSLATTFVAPATLVSTLLFYFGYVSARAQYQYFGIDVDTIGLSTQDYVMRSPQPLLVPLLLLTLIGVVAMRAQAWLTRRLPAADAEAPRQHWRQRVELVQRFGFALVGLAVLVLLGYPYLRGWAAYPLVTPLLFVFGGAIVAYAARLERQLMPGTGRRSSVVLILLVLVANIFWATATIAQWSGRALARDDARHLTRLPSVILDTKERLFLRDDQVVETALPAATGQTFHFRYRGFRLLIEGNDRMFLVPERWSASDSTLMVPVDSSIRVQFQFVNDPP